MTSALPDLTADRNTSAAHPPLEIFTSWQFLSWLREECLSLAHTTYRIGKLSLLGSNPQGELSVFDQGYALRAMCFVSDEIRRMVSIEV